MITRKPEESRGDYYRRLALELLEASFEARRRLNPFHEGWFYGRYRATLDKADEADVEDLLEPAEPKPARNGMPWNRSEDERLETLWGRLPVRTIARMLERSEWSITLRATKALNLRSPSTYRWSIRAISRLSGFSEGKIVNAIKKLHLKPRKSFPADPRYSTERRTYSDEQAEALTRFMLDNSTIFSDTPGSTRTTDGAWGVGRKAACCAKCSRKDRFYHARNLCQPCYQASRRQGPVGKPGHSKGFTRLDIKIIREQHAKGVSMRKLAAHFGVTRQAIAKIVKRQTWKHV